MINPHGHSFAPESLHKLERAENYPLIFCDDCNEVVPWFLSDADLCCKPAHHVIATFHEKQPDAGTGCRVIL